MTQLAQRAMEKAKALNSNRSGTPKQTPKYVESPHQYAVRKAKELNAHTPPPRQTSYADKFLTPTSWPSPSIEAPSSYSSPREESPIYSSKGHFKAREVVYLDEDDDLDDDLNEDLKEDLNDDFKEVKVLGNQKSESRFSIVRVSKLLLIILTIFIFITVVIPEGNHSTMYLPPSNTRTEIAGYSNESMMESIYRISAFVVHHPVTHFAAAVTGGAFIGVKLL